MLNFIFHPGKSNEPEIQALKKKHEKVTIDSQKKIKAVNEVLKNGFAIKIYYAHGGGKK